MEERLVQAIRFMLSNAGSPGRTTNEGDTIITSGIDGNFTLETSPNSVIFEDITNEDPRNRTRIPPSRHPQHYRSKSTVKVQRDKETFVMLVLCDKKNDGSVETEMREFSFPVDIDEVENWSNLVDLWFFEIEGMDLTDPEFLKREVNKLNTKKMIKYSKHLEPEKVYLVCGYSFEQDDDIIYSMPNELDAGSPSPLDPSTANIHNVNFDEYSIIDKFKIITGCTYRDACFYIDLGMNNLKAGLEEYFKINPIVPITMSDNVYNRMAKDENMEKLRMMQELMKNMGKKVVIPDYEADDGLICAKSRKDVISTQLLVAAKEGKLDKIKVLMSLKSIDLKFKDDNQRNILHFVGFDSNTKILEHLLKNCEKEMIELINEVDKSGISPIRVSVSQKASHTVKLLIEFAQKHKIMLYQNENKCPLLTLAVEKDDIKTVKLLLTIKGIKFLTNAGYPPLIFSCNGCSIEMTKLIVKAHPEAVNEISRDPKCFKESPLLGVCHQDGPQAIKIGKYLISKGANINYQNEDGSTPLHHAISGANLTMAKYLVEQGCDLKLTLKNGIGHIKHAMNRRFYDLVHLMQNYGQKKLRSGEGGEGDGFLNAVSNQNVTKVAELIKSPRLDINQREKVSMRTSLHISIEIGNLSIAKMLILAGIDFYLKDCFGRTAGHYCKIFHCSTVGEKVLGMLVLKGFDLGSEDFDKISVRHFQSSSNIVKPILYMNLKPLSGVQLYGINRQLGYDSKGISHIFDIYNDTMAKLNLDKNDQAISKSKSSLNKEEDQEISEGEQQYRNYSDIIRLKYGQLSLFIDGYQVTQNYKSISLSPRGLHLNYDGFVNPHISANDLFEFEMVWKMDIVHQFSIILTILHHMNIFHKNIRPDNMLKNESNGILLTNFGFDEILKNFRSDDIYVAPEVKELGYDLIDAKSDIYSFGQTVFYFLFREHLKPNEVFGIPPNHHLKKLVDVLTTCVKDKNYRPTMFTLVTEAEEALHRTILALRKEYQNSLQQLQSNNVNRMMQMKIAMQTQISAKVKQLDKLLIEYKLKVKERRKLIYSFAHNEESVQQIDFEIVPRNITLCTDRLKKLLKQSNLTIDEKKIDILIKFLQNKCEGKCSEEIFEVIDKILSISAKNPKFLVLSFDIMKMLFSCPNSLTRFLRSEIAIIDKMMEFVKKFEEMKRGSKVMCIRMFCNIMTVPDGVCFVFEENRFKMLIKMITHGLKQSDKKSLPLRLGAAALLNNISIHAHVFVGVNLDQLVCDIISVVNDSNKEEISHDFVDRMLSSLYKLLKHKHSYKKCIKLHAKEKKIDLLKLMLSLEDLGLEKIFVISISAMLLGLEEFEKLKKLLGYKISTLFKLPQIVPYSPFGDNNSKF